MGELTDAINGKKTGPNKAQAVDKSFLATVAEMLGAGKSKNAPIKKRNQEQADQLNEIMKDM